MISGFRSRISEIMVLLGCNAAFTASYLPTYRDNLSVQEPRSQDNMPYKVLFSERCKGNMNFFFKNVPQGQYVI